MKKHLNYIDYMKEISIREQTAKRKWREIQKKKKMGIKNPYDHFINNLPTNLPKLASITL